MNRERGVVLVQLALFLPLFMALILIVVWIGLMLNARASMTQALGSAARLGATRGNDLYIGRQLFGGDIHAWVGAGIEDDLKPFFINFEDTNGYGVDYLNHCAPGAFDGKTLGDLPAVYKFVLLYVNAAMSESIGRSIKYPCLARPSPCGSYNFHPGHDGAGCMGCRFLNPQTYDLTPWPVDAQAPIDRIAIECRYQPDHLLLRPITALLGMGSAENMVVITKTAVFDASTISIEAPP